MECSKTTVQFEIVLYTTVKVLGAILAFGCAMAEAQTVSLSPSPTTLIAGGGAQTVSLSTIPLASVPFTATWNGVRTPITVTSSAVPYGTVFSVNLTAGDLTVSQLGQFALYDGRTNALIASAAIPVIYPVTAAETLYDASRGRVYISTAATPSPSNPDFYAADPRFPSNSLIALDVQTGKIVHTLNLNGAGGAIAISDDATALYVVVTPNIVRRVDPETLTAVGDFSLPPLESGFGGTVTAVVDAIAVMPGAPETLAIQYSGTGAKFGIFDDGVERANIAGDVPSLSGSFGRMLFSPDAKYLFVGDNQNFPSITDGFLVDSSGIPKQTPLSALAGGPVAIVGDTLYTINGISLNWHTMEVTGNLDRPNLVAVDPVNSRILACFAPPQYSPYKAILQAFDLPTQSGLGNLPLPVGPTNLTRFGADGLIAQLADSILTFHTPLAGPAPLVTPQGVVNAASFLGGTIAPGEIIGVFGSSLGPTAGASFTVAGTNIVSPAGMEVWFDRRQGTVLFAQSGQMNVVAPFELEPGSTVQLQIWNNGIPSAQIPLTIAATAPALFTRNGSGQGPVAMINQDGTVNTPAPRGSVVSLYGAGGGIYPGAHDGDIARGISSLSATVQVSIGAQNAQVFYTGAAPELVSSVFQLNVQIPTGIPPGSSVPVVVTIGGQSSPQGVTIEVR